VTSTPRHSEAAFETVNEYYLLGHGYVALSCAKAHGEDGPRRQWRRLHVMWRLPSP